MEKREKGNKKSKIIYRRMSEKKTIDLNPRFLICRKIAYLFYFIK